mmetsp:Transcript_42079/g.83067  ORF Transcript_42079/g.83067 Transcript_42079/m.83067 type:complete len:138 (+) Transcript_42079:1703-2116(+)
MVNIQIESGGQKKLRIDACQFVHSLPSCLFPAQRSPHAWCYKHLVFFLFRKISSSSHFSSLSPSSFPPRLFHSPSLVDSSPCVCAAVGWREDQAMHPFSFLASLPHFYLLFCQIHTLSRPPSLQSPTLSVQSVCLPF